MKKRIFIVALLFVVLIALNNFFSISSLKEKSMQQTADLAGESRKQAGEDIELGNVMTKLQRHVNKLWFSGKAANWPLAAFYIHELDETFEELTIREVIDEGVNISALTETMGLKPLESVKLAVKNKDVAEFKSSYENLVSHCNTCHQSSNHPFVVIKTPITPALDNQVYEVQQD